MSRELDPALETEIGQQVLRPFLALYIATPDPVRVTTLNVLLQFDDADGVEQEWIGAGGVGSVEAAGETTDGSATGLKASLFQVPSRFREDVADQAVRGVRFELGIGAVDTAFRQVVGFKWLNRCRLDDYRIIDNGDTITVEVTGESRGIDGRRPSIKRFTDEWQQRHHPGDVFFQYVPQMAEVPILWAAAAQDSTATGGASGAYSGGGGATRA